MKGPFDLLLELYGVWDVVCRLKTEDSSSIGLTWWVGLGWDGEECEQTLIEIYEFPCQHFKIKNNGVEKAKMDFQMTSYL